jgi:hypothetical protein
MPYILEMKGMRLAIKDEQYPVYKALEELLARVRKKFRSAALWYHGLQGLCYCPCIEIHNRSLADFRRLLAEFTGTTSYSLTKRGRRIERASAVTADFTVSFDADHKITISPVKRVDLDVLAPETA